MNPKKPAIVIDDNTALKITLTVHEAVALTGVGRSQLYKAMQAGTLKAKKRGKTTLFRPDDLRAWIDSLPDFVATVAAE